MHSTMLHVDDRPQRLGRPRKSPEELRTDELRLYLTPAKKQRLDEDAHAAGMRPAEYVRRLIQGHRPTAIDSRPYGNPRLLLELNAIGNNLNQAVRDVHAGSRRQHDWDRLRTLLEAVLVRIAVGEGGGGDDVC